LLSSTGGRRLLACRNSHEFYSVLHFCRSFKAALHLPELTAVTLEDELIKDEPSSILIEIIARLLKTAPASKHITMDKWSADLSRALTIPNRIEPFFAFSLDPHLNEIPFDPLQGKGFFEAETQARLLVLHALIEWCLEINADVRSHAVVARDHPPGGEGRQPAMGRSYLGMDSAGKAYHHTGFGSDCRLWCETLRGGIKASKENNKPRSLGERGPKNHANKHVFKHVEGSVPWSTPFISLPELRDFLTQLKKSKKLDDRSLYQVLLVDVLPLMEQYEEENAQKIAREELRKKRIFEEEERRMQLRAMEAAGLVRRSSRADSIAEAEAEARRKATEKEEARLAKQAHADRVWADGEKDRRRVKAIQDSARREQEKRVRVEEHEAKKRKKSRELEAALVAQQTNTAMGKEPDAWIQCDKPGCGKWRRVPQSVAERIGETQKWHCEYNMDNTFAGCEIRQELPNHEITNLLAKEAKEQQEIQRLVNKKRREEERQRLNAKRAGEAQRSREGEALGGYEPFNPLGPRKRKSTEHYRMDEEEEKPKRPRAAKPIKQPKPAAGNFLLPLGQAEGHFVQCERCDTWRLLPPGIVPEMLPVVWECEAPPLPHSRCGVPDPKPPVPPTLAPAPGASLEQAGGLPGGAGLGAPLAAPVVMEVGEWVGCERCDIWRQLPVGFDPRGLPEEWECGMGPLPDSACGVPDPPAPGLPKTLPPTAEQAFVEAPPQGGGVNWRGAGAALPPPSPAQQAREIWKARELAKAQEQAQAQAHVHAQAQARAAREAQRGIDLQQQQQQLLFTQQQQQQEIMQPPIQQQQQMPAEDVEVMQFPPQLQQMQQEQQSALAQLQQHQSLLVLTQMEQQEAPRGGALSAIAQLVSALPGYAAAAGQPP